MKKLTSGTVIRDLAFLAPAIIALFIFKFPHLSLPGFWDEAWSYMPAILKMAETGPSLLPDASSAGLFRGHPLLFYAMQSLWINIFGHSFAAMRMLPLLISSGVLVFLYLFTKKHFGRRTAMITATFLLIQAVFLAQSSMMLPEMLLALLTLFALDSFLDGKKGWYILWATLLALTKETGLVLIGTCLLLHFAAPLWNNEKSTLRERFNTSFYLWAPLLIDVMFILAQRFITGWFFFPEHIGLLSFSLPSVFDRLIGYASFLLISYGRNLLTFFSVAALIYVMVRKIPVTGQEKRILFPLAVFAVFYLLFLSINFYSPRYLLSVIPIFIIFCIFIIDRATSKIPLLGYALLLVVFANNIWFTWDFRRDADHNLGFADAVEVQRQAIAFCSEHHWQDSAIATQFLVKYYMEHPDAGYVPQNKTFRNASLEVAGSTHAAVITSTEYSEAFKEQILKSNMLLVRRFEKKHSWAEVYTGR